jgi:hypothetical protein
VSALREVLAQFDVDTSGADSKLQNVAKNIDSTVSALGNLASSFIKSKMVQGLGDFVTGWIDAAKEVRIGAQRLGVSTDELEEWSFAAKTAGVDAEGAANGLKFLNKNVGLALDGNKEAAQTFAKLDIALKDSGGNVREVGDLLPEVADAFEKMGSQQERTAAAMKIFGRQGADLLPLLQGGSKNVEQLRQKFHDLGGGMSEDFIEKAKQAGKSIGAAKFGLNAFKRSIAYEFFPVVKIFGDKMQGIVGFLLRLTRETKIAKEAAVALGIGAAVSAATAASGFAKFLGILPKGASFWETVLGLGEFVLIAVAIAALFLLFEDFFTMVQGGDSVLRGVLDDLFGIGTADAVVAQVKETFAQFMAEVQAFQPVVEAFGELFQNIWPYALVALKAFGKYGLEWIASLLTGVVKAVELLVAAVGGMFAVLGKGAKAVGDLIGNEALSKFGSGAELGGAKAALAGAQAFGLAGKGVEAPHNALEGSERTINHAGNDITINNYGLPDARAAGDATKKGVQRGLDNEYETGGTFDALNTGS